jgi:hypothetical protein
LAFIIIKLASGLMRRFTARGCIAARARELFERGGKVCAAQKHFQADNVAARAAPAAVKDALSQIHGKPIYAAAFGAGANKLGALPFKPHVVPLKRLCDRHAAGFLEPRIDARFARFACRTSAVWRVTRRPLPNTFGILPSAAILAGSFFVPTKARESIGFIIWTLSMKPPFWLHLPRQSYIPVKRFGLTTSLQFARAPFLNGKQRAVRGRRRSFSQFPHLIRSLAAKT